MLLLIPFLLGCGVLVLSGLLWWSLNQQRMLNMERFVQSETSQVASTITHDFDRRVQALQWFVSTWEQQGDDLTQDEFNSLTSTLLLEYPGFQAIQWINSDLKVQWVIPLAGNEAVRHMNVAFNESRRIALQRAQHMKVPTMTPLLNLVQGGKGFIVYFPLHINGRFNGFLTAVFRADRWIEHVLENEAPDEPTDNFVVTARIDGTQVYRSVETSANSSPNINQYSQRFNLLEHQVSVTCRPRGHVSGRVYNQLPEIALAGGIVTALLLVFVSFMYLKNQHEKREIQSEKTALQLEAAEREVIRQTVTQQSNMQNLLMNIATNYINVSMAELEPAIHQALGKMALFVNADRAYVFDYNLTQGTTSNTHEWCQFGVPPQKDQLQDIPLEGVKEWLHAHSQGLPIRIDSVDELPAGKLRDLLQQQRIKSVLAVPMLHGRNLIGYVGFDWISSTHKFSDRELDLLKLFSEILVNINQRIDADKRIIESRNRMELALRGTNSGLWDWHVDTGRVIFNERWAEIVGYDLAELDPTIHTWEKLCHPVDLEKSGRRLKAHFSGQTDFYECELRMKHKNGEWIWVLDRGQVVERDGNNEPVRMTGTHMDITALKRAQTQLLHLANHDELTGLPTRRLAQDRGQMAIQRAMRNGEHTAFLFVDLDGFKPVNDNFGHEVGDRLLKEVAIRLQASVRKSDTVARIGGDEFLIILDAFKDKEDVRRIASVVIDTLSVPILFENYPPMSVGCSIGIALFPDDGNDFEHLIQRADVAMYHVKGNGKNHYRFAKSDVAPPTA